MDCDLLVIGGGLAGLVAATEATARGLKVIVLDQEGEQNLGGQAFWSLGGLFFVDSPEQRFMRVRDSLDLARQDWMGSAQFDRRKTTGRANGRKPISTSPPAKSARGCIRSACAGSR